MTKKRPSGGKKSPPTKKEETPELYAEEIDNQWCPRFSLKTLTTSIRQSAILLHRKELKNERFHDIRQYAPSRHRQRGRGQAEGGASPPRRFGTLTPILLREMSVKSDYRGRSIELEIIEAALSDTHIVLLGQDENAQTVFVYLHTNKPDCNDPALQDKVGFGTKIIIGNPIYLKMNNRLALKVLDDDNLFLHPDRDEWKCRFCLKEDSRIVPCNGCTRVFYCSLECSAYDWERMDHRLICQDIYKGRKQHGEEDTIWNQYPWPVYVAIMGAIGAFYYFCIM